MTILEWALWGVLGAFVYAAPRILLAWSDAENSKIPMRVAIAEFMIAHIIGAICSAAFGAAAARLLGRPVDELRAVGLVIGLVANPITPSIVKYATGAILGRIGVHPKHDDPVRHRRGQPP